jgi:septum site-determining protein MinD
MRTIAIASGKAGVGKSTISMNLALALNNYGRQVILIDANFDFPHLGLMLGKSNFEETIISAIEKKKTMNDVVYRHQSGLKIIPGNISLEHLHKKDINAFINLLPQLKNYAEALIIDLNSGFNKDVFEIINNCSDLIIITTPDIVSITETLKLLKIIREKSNTKIMGVVLNKHSSRSYDMKIENIQSLLQEKVIGVIPDHKSIKESLKFKYPVVYSHPDAPTTKAFEEIACKIIGEKYEEKKVEKKNKMIDLLEKVGLKKWYESLMEEDDE